MARGQRREPARFDPVDVREYRVRDTDVAVSLTCGRKYPMSGLKRQSFVPVRSLLIERGVGHERRMSRSLVILLLGLSGCGGHAMIHQIPMGIRKISTTGALIQKTAPDECYYWVNEAGELCVAMRKAKWSPLGKRFRSEFIASFVFEGLPARTARDYRMTQRTFRARLEAGYTHTRSASLAGIAAVWDYGQRRLRGRFRFSAKHQSYSVLTGWGANKGLLVVGEFTAVPNRRAGEKILARTEKRGLERGPPRGKRSSPTTK